MPPGDARQDSAEGRGDNRTLILACGALAHEIVALMRINGWSQFTVQCLPADLHNRPGEIPEAVRAGIHKARSQFDHVFVAYADCGTGGLLDRVLAEEGVERLPGAHCYEFFAGSQAFHALAEQEPGTLYLTDFLARHFDRLIVRGMGLDRYPQMRDILFANYTRLVYLAQTVDAALEAKAQDAATYLGLRYEYRFTGYGELETTLGSLHPATGPHEKVVTWRRN